MLDSLHKHIVMSTTVTSRLGLRTDVLLLNSQLGTKMKHKVINFSSIRTLKTLCFGFLLKRHYNPLEEGMAYLTEET